MTYTRPKFTGRDIVRRIQDADSSLSQIGRELDPPVTHVAVHMVIYGRSRSDRIADKIASVVRINKGLLWPQWYSRAA